MADTLTKEKRSWNMSRIRGENTKPELILRSLLHKAGFRFKIHDKNLPGRPDIVLPRYQTAIFVNGCFWHRHSGCKQAYMPKSRQDFWNKKFDATVRRDKKKKESLEQADWNVLTVWECELQNDPGSVVTDIIKRLGKEARS